MVIEADNRQEQKLFIGLRPRSMLYVDFKFMKGDISITGRSAKIEAKAVSIPDRALGAHGYPGFEDTEYIEYEVFWDEKKGQWYSFMTPGKYLLNAKS